MGHFFQPLVLVLVLLAVAVSINAEEKWSWSKPNGGGGGAAADRSSPDRVRSDVIAFQDTKRFGSDTANDRKFNQQQDVRYERLARYEVKESTTKRPTLGRPQNDEFSGEVGNQQSDFGFNQRFGGPGGGQFPQTPYGFNPGFGGGNVGLGGGNPYYGGGGNPYFGGGGYPPQGGFGGGYGGAANGILVGPQGPTGIIGRPYGGHNGGGYPGGYPGGFGGVGGYPPYPAGGIGGYPGAGIGGYFGGQGPYGPSQFGQFGGARPFGPQFDQAKQANKKVEKKSV
ncbi:hypothetical protein quinque_008572 [Culex quinquefasciatus]